MDKGIQLPQGRIQWSRPGGETIVVVAGGRRPDPQWLRKASAAFPEPITAKLPGWYPVFSMETGTAQLRELGKNLSGRGHGPRLIR